MHRTRNSRTRKETGRRRSFGSLSNFRPHKPKSKQYSTLRARIFFGICDRQISTFYNRPLTQAHLPSDWSSRQTSRRLFRRSLASWQRHPQCQQAAPSAVSRCVPSETGRRWAAATCWEHSSRQTTLSNPAETICWSETRINAWSIQKQGKGLPTFRRRMPCCQKILEYKSACKNNPLEPSSAP